MDILLNLDKAIFYFINHSLSNRFFDWLMPLVTDTSNWRLPILLALIATAVFKGKEGRDTLYLCLIALILSDFTSNRIFKPLFHRARPFEVIENARQLVQAYGYSFPSSHAANSFSLALAVSFIWKNRWITAALLFLAFLSGISRIYVGVHYPLDMLGGILLAGLSVFAGIKLLDIIKGLIAKLAGKDKKQ